ncbi:nuclear pore complex protein Nup75, partial [Culicoides brevitarsis]|uniref:nuclear pore complex protein Nup75 n=1 Tax=Culicoides brevitarsis TaxID=469753 RepID=UPI00307CA42E
NDSLGERVGRFFGNYSAEQKISLNAFNPVICSTLDAPSCYADSNKQTSIHQLEPELVFDLPVLRSLLSETCNTFVELQHAIKNTDMVVNYKKISIIYRSSIRACLENLQHLVLQQGISKSEDNEKYQNLMTVLYSVECIWHLCEKVFLLNTNDSCIVHQLLEWVRFHFPMSEQNAIEMIQAAEEVHTDENYWYVVKDLIMKGQIDVARALLRMHLAADTPCFHETDRILSSIPVLNAYNGLSIQKFRTTWNHWVITIENKLQSGLFSAEPDLEGVVRLIIGESNAWKDVCKTSKCWYEYFPGYLFYTEPTCRDFELPHYVNTWLTQWLSVQGFGRTAHLKHLDRVIHSVMENNLHQVLHDVQNIGDNKWVVTHLTDLLFHAGKLKGLGDDSMSINAFRDNLIFNFGKDLMSRRSFWKFGLNYLEFCKDGPVARELLLVRVPFNKDTEALKLISIAKQIQARGVEQQICRVLVLKYISHARYGNALHWALRSNDTFYIQVVVDYFLKHYTETGEMMCPDILSCIGSRMLISPRLMFLIKYYEFHQCYRDRAFSQAGEILINLLDSNVTPKFFWSSLLADTIPLLEFKEPIIPSKETLIILQHLQNDLIPFIDIEKQCMISKADPITGTSYERKEDLIQLLRLSCARNLSRALIIENTLSS